ncbi:bifunctional 2-polyprenyl-6-hydroxyphenol methylase/3-demethylubiquinol 3-O-methyltransferase UbiG [Aquabacter spiritensis]|uniref:Ubiquinone biosynthesis O-methyltransferase n=1 Tax=Aquabacter spiritensis TaxID=933073 RepID=A0A4R3LYT3_9HYPH|nr:bifunctional 2-polyprenyl-6-hydroxyphenol methylase/3-demethylubiquinol 3-O-methyltransferase UbiG [Aquabacter spiritensis]TCT05019.1 3-demethylubiquinone-9 3-methyltransferase [Aquabacter spiritensis]
MTVNAAVDDAEIARFDALGEDWWDPKGKMAPLHAINPVRLGFVRDVLVRHFGRDPRSLRPLKGLRLLDIGCGGGLMSEPLARMGGEVTGIDPAPGNVDVARRHAAATGLAVDYRAVTAGELDATGARFDVVLALEVVEHVPDVAGFVREAGRLVAPGGVLVVSTLNRTAKSFALVIVGAEYVLRWLPRGTHRWDRFVTPDEFEAVLGAAGFSPTERIGLVFDPLGGAWKLSPDLDVNYFLVATRAD